MSDREAFEKWCETQESTYHKSGMWKAWQAAQAQAGDREAVGYVYHTTGGAREVSWFDSQEIEDDALLYTTPPAAKVNQQLLEAIKVCASFLSDFGLENSDAYQQALFAIAAAQEQSK